MQSAAARRGHRRRPHAAARARRDRRSRWHDRNPATVQPLRGDSTTHSMPPPARWSDARAPATVGSGSEQPPVGAHQRPQPAGDPLPTTPSSSAVPAIDACRTRQPSSPPPGGRAAGPDGQMAEAASHGPAEPLDEVSTGLRTRDIESAAWHQGLRWPVAERPACRSAYEARRSGIPARRRAPRGGPFTPFSSHRGRLAHQLRRRSALSFSRSADIRTSLERRRNPNTLKASISHCGEPTDRSGAQEDVPEPSIFSEPMEWAVLISPDSSGRCTARAVLQEVDRERLADLGVRTLAVLFSMPSTTSIVPSSRTCLSGVAADRSDRRSSRSSPSPTRRMAAPADPRPPFGMSVVRTDSALPTAIAPGDPL